MTGETSDRPMDEAARRNEGVLPQPVARRVEDREQFPALTGLRGVAAFWVFLHHWNLFRFGTGKGIHFLAVGYLAVDLFFLLSGFVMVHSRYASFQPWRPGPYARYLCERLVRLLPTNMAVLLIYAAALALVPSVEAEWPAYVHSARSFFTSFFLVQSWLPYPLGGWIAPGWSVSVELAAYCALPIVLWLVRRFDAALHAAGAAAACILAFVAVLVLHGEHDPNISVKGGFLRVGCEFLAGGALYRAWLLRLRFLALGATGIAAAAIGLALTVHLQEAQFLALPGFAVLLLLAAQDDGPAVVVFSHPLSKFLGRISFSLYLVHWPALVFWQHFGGFSRSLFSNGAMIGATMAGATLVHFAVEAPSHRLARRIRRKTGTTATGRRRYE